MIKKVLQLGNPELRKSSTEVEDLAEAEKIVEDLRNTLIYEQQDKEIGRALAAPQIGIHKKVVFYHVDGEEKILINPKITEKSEELFEVWDSCFSLRTAFFVKIKRHKEIKVEYQNLQGENIEEKFAGELSELFQHEIDHLHGILATDHLEDNKNIMMREEWEKR